MISISKHFACILFFFLGFYVSQVYAENGYDLWLRYTPIEDVNLKESYSNQFKNINFKTNTETLTVAKKELLRGLDGMLGSANTVSNSTSPSVFIGLKSQLPSNLKTALNINWEDIGAEGFVIKQIDVNEKSVLVLSANTDIGVLYGVFNLLRTMQMHQDLSLINIQDAPQTDIRILNHWDNLDRTVERGYAGFSIWDWHKLPEYLNPRYEDYARANASVGINATVLTNVNANALVLSPQYIEKVKALAQVFRPYGIKVYLTARFSAPIELGGLETADPFDTGVKTWWKNKAAEIYKEIPDFGGFLVKANSEGQPGPQNYGRTHVDGANMLADALAPHNGIVMWRAFVYSEHDPTDRAKQAYSEFVPYDGQFRDNVIIQVKNGAIDFQPREPFHPMFGAMPKTPLMMEFQITQEYLGFSTHLVYLPKLYEEVLQADTYREGKGSTVAKVVDGSLHNKKITGIAGVANIGTDMNWTGHPFAQANWYGFGRLAWHPHLSSQDIAKEWLKLTFTSKEEFVAPMQELLLDSREAVVRYMTPLGLHHMMDTGHHYGPGPWVSNLSRPEWNPVYYHKADSLGIGFDRSDSGSNATAQYANQLETKFNDPSTTPEQFLLWFHHLPWDYKVSNGTKLWDAIGLTYQEGVDDVKKMQQTWQDMKPFVDETRFEEVSMALSIQLKEAKWWRDACMLYFQQFSKMPFPDGMAEPEHDLNYYQSLQFPYAPGIKPRW